MCSCGYKSRHRHASHNTNGTSVRVQDLNMLESCEYATKRDSTLRKRPRGSEKGDRVDSKILKLHRLPRRGLDPVTANHARITHVHGM